MRLLKHSFFCLVYALFSQAAYGLSSFSEIKPNLEEISKEYFRADYKNLSSEDFDIKWQESLESPLLFFRSYVKTWYREFSTLKSVGPIGYCLGDAHPENFGYLWRQDGSYPYVFNDLDDSGLCPIAADALRYLIALSLYTQDGDLVEQVASEYARVLKGGENRKLPIWAYKSWQKKNEKNLKKYVEGATLKPGKLEKVQPEERLIIESALKGMLPSFYMVQDVASYVKTSGGSAGLKRYWILVEDKNASIRDILELKPYLQPATYHERWALPSDHNDPLTAAAFIYGKQMDLVSFGQVTIDNRLYQLRSRTKSDLDLEDLSFAEQEEIFLLQVGLIAKHHRRYVKDVDTLTKWLSSQVSLATHRYLDIYHNAL